MHDCEDYNQSKCLREKFAGGRFRGAAVSVRTAAKWRMRGRDIVYMGISHFGPALLANAPCG